MSFTDVLKDIYRNMQIQKTENNHMLGHNLIMVSRMSFAHKRTGRIVAALFVVTNLLSDSNPIRHRIRHLGVNLMSFMVPQSILSTEDDLKRSFSARYAERFLEVVSLLEISFISGDITEMNYKLISEEIDSLITAVERVEKLSESSGSEVGLSSIFLNEKESGRDSKVLPSYSTKLYSKITFSKGHPIGHQDTEEKKKMTFRKSKLVRAMSEKDKELRNERKSKILSLLKEGRKLTLKDFVSSIPGVSEKTIQRELLSFMNSGVLKREGSRRWTRYFIEGNVFEQTQNRQNHAES